MLSMHVLGKHLHQSPEHGLSGEIIDFSVRLEDSSPYEIEVLALDYYLVQVYSKNICHKYSYISKNPEGNQHGG